jgi:hypothetical protein
MTRLDALLSAGRTAKLRPLGVLLAAPAQPTASLKPIRIDQYQSEVIAQSPWRATAGMSGWVQTYGTTAKNKNTAKITK